MTCGEFKKALENQPDDKPIAFTTIGPDSAVQHFTVSESYSHKLAFYVELEPVEVCHA